MHPALHPFMSMSFTTQESCSAQSLKEGRVDSNIRSAIDWLLEVILHQWKPLQTRVTQDVVKMLEEEEREKIERKKRVEMRRKMRCVVD